MIRNFRSKKYFYFTETQSIPLLIATKINKEIFRNRNKTIGEVIDSVCNNINDIFSIMNLYVKLIGLSEDNETKHIFKLYESIGENNQLIKATHSPHVICNITSDKLRVMVRDNNGIKIVDNDKLSETNSKGIGDILTTTMNLDSLRNDDITKKLNKVYELLNKNFS